MCGICGIAAAKVLPDGTYNIVQRMTQQMLHRGPDSDGFYQSAHVELGFRRLSIIDLSTGDQPIGNETGSIQIVFNGEVYNFHGLRDELIQRGHKFRTKTDTETIVHAYEEYGIDLVKRLRGMYAFALWDETQGLLYLVRDRLGKKPLYYALTNGRLIFASELKALLAYPDISREINTSALDAYLTWGYVPAPSSIFQGIYKLPPAHWLRYNTQQDEIRLQSYWQLDYSPKMDVTFEEAAEQLRAILSEATRLRLISDVQLGALLSGGVDSSIVVGLMAENSSQSVKTFSIGFRDRKFNELPYAREVAQRFGTQHTEIIVQPDVVDVLENIVWYLDEPMADSSVLPTYYVAWNARQHVTVVLNGDGGDENFSGYRSHNAMLIYQRYNQLPHWLRADVISPLVEALPNVGASATLINRMKRLVVNSRIPHDEQYLSWQSIFNAELRHQLYSPTFAASIENAPGIELHAIPNKELHIIDWMLAHNVHNHLPGGLLVKMDRMSMGNSLEARSPLLDHEMMEFAARLPVHYKRQGTQSKIILKHACSDLLPQIAVTRPKQGFSIPLDQWMRGELKHLMSDALRSLGERGFFDNNVLKRLWAEHQQGTNHGRRLWALLILEIWYKHFVH